MRKKLNVLVACEYSGVVRDAFRKRGHNAWSCDLLPCDGDDTYHIEGDVLDVISGKLIGAGAPFKIGYVPQWDLMIAHPPCTYLCNSGVRWLYKGGKYWQDDAQGPLPDGFTTRVGGEKDPVRWKLMLEARNFFTKLIEANIPHIAVENPIMHHWGRSFTNVGAPDQIIQPWQFGHGETKATCLWLKDLPKLKPTEIVSGRAHRIHLLPPGPERAKIRSRTFEGIAAAMAEQWSSYIMKGK